MGPGNHAEVPVFIFCSLKSKQKGRTSLRQSLVRCNNLCVAISFTFHHLSFIHQDRKSSRKTCLTFIPRFFFLISSEMNMNTLWSLHSAGANPPLEALGNLIPPCGYNLSTQAFLQALLKGPQWTQPCSLCGSITFRTMGFFLFSFLKKIT